MSWGGFRLESEARVPSIESKCVTDKAVLHLCTAAEIYSPAARKAQCVVTKSAGVSDDVRQGRQNSIPYPQVIHSRFPKPAANGGWSSVRGTQQGIFASKMDTPDTLQQAPDTPCGKPVEYQPLVVHRLCVTLWIEKFFYRKIASDLRKQSSHAVDYRKIWRNFIHRRSATLSLTKGRKHPKHAANVMHLTNRP